MNTGKRSCGFTLIELLIVVAIIAILAMIAVPNFLEAQTRAKISRAKADMRSLSVALQAYRVDYNQYPPDVDGTGYPELHNYWGSEIASWLYLTTPVAYMTSIPRDPFYMTQAGSPPGISNKAVAYFEYGEENNRDVVGPPARSAAMHASGCGFLVVCMGPDRFGCFNWSANEWLAVGRNDGTAIGQNGRCICYDPTNGTVSVGDIIMSAKGIYGSK